MADYPSAVTSFALLVDLVDEILAAHPNERGDEIVATQLELGINPAGPATDVAVRLNRSIPEDFNVETQTLSATLELSDSNLFIQRVDCNGANRIVEFAAANDQNHATLIVNKSSGAYSITLKDSTGAITYGTIDKGYSALCMPDGNGGWLVNNITPYNYPVPSLGFISEQGAVLAYVSATSYSVSAGSADVNGELLTWAASITRSSLSITADTIYYVYLYNNSGTPAVEESTTVPVWDSAVNYYKKTGDATRRCIGFIEASDTNTLRKFLNTTMGRVSEFIYTDGQDTTTDKRVVSGGSVSTSWQTFPLAPLVPSHATHVYMLAKLIFTTILDDAVLGLSPIDLGSATGNFAPFDVRDKGAAAGASTFFGTSWLAISTSQTYFYRLFHVTGTTTTTNIEVHGARIVR